MPIYLRWIAAISSGITAQFAFFILFGAIALGTGNRNIDASIGIIATLGSTVVAIVPALAVNDWLAKRYPKELPEPERERSDVRQ